MNLGFILKAENPRAETAEVKLESRSLVINGREAKTGFNFLPEKIEFSIPKESQNRPGIAEIPVRLELDISALSADGFSLLDDMELNAGLGLAAVYTPNSKTEAASVKMMAEGKAVFTPVQRPVFSITEIAVIKDELVNTKFRVKLKIHNPNPFSVELSSFLYELYGDGRFWADGKELNVFVIPGRNSEEAELKLTMNFIDMKRPLLDQIVNLKDVNYRFKGEAVVATGIEYIPHFVNPFDLSGYSRVLEK